MIETWACKSCKYSGADQEFYQPGKGIAVCPKCGSEDIVLVGGYEIVK